MNWRTPIAHRSKPKAMRAMQLKHKSQKQNTIGHQNLPSNRNSDRCPNPKILEARKTIYGTISSIHGDLRRGTRSNSGCRSSRRQRCIRRISWQRSGSKSKNCAFKMKFSTSNTTSQGLITGCNWPLPPPTSSPKPKNTSIKSKRNIGN